MTEINQHAPTFTAQAFHEKQIKNISLEDFRGKWKIIFFYPADFTFVCPTELGDLADSYDKLKEIGAEVLSVSTDTVFTHKAWHDTSETIKKIKFPMIADPTHQISKAYRVIFQKKELP